MSWTCPGHGDAAHLPSCCARLSLSYLQSACDASSSGKKPTRHCLRRVADASSTSDAPSSGEDAEQHRKEGDAARPHVGTKGVPRLGEHLRRAVGARAAAMVEHLHLVRGRGAVCALAERLVLVREPTGGGSPGRLVGGGGLRVGRLQACRGRGSPKVDHAEGEVGGEHEVLELEVAVQHAWKRRGARRRQPRGRGLADFAPRRCSEHPCRARGQG